MNTSNFFSKLKSKYLWGNLLAMAITAVVLVVGVKLGLDAYTHHGESIEIPNLKGKSVTEAERILSDLDMVVEVTDTGYVKTLPADAVLEQSPAAGARVKSGHIVRLTINASKSPTITLPDIIDNSSLREALAKLTAMGFKVGIPEFVPGEKDWVYGVLVKGKNVQAGDRISIDDMVVIQAGSGMLDDEDTVQFVEPVYDESMESDEFDSFEEVTGPNDL